MRRKARRVISQFSPADWTTFHWEGTADFTHYITVVLLLAVFLAAELNPFYLKVSISPTKSIGGDARKGSVARQVGAAHSVLGQISAR